MRFEQLQAIEYSLSVINEIFNLKTTQNQVNYKLVFEYQNKFFTANTCEPANVSRPKLKSLDYQNLRIIENYYSVGSKPEKIIFSEVRHLIFEKFGNLYYVEDLINDNAFLLEYLKKMTSDIDYSKFDTYQKVFKNIEFLENGLTLPFIDLEDANDDIKIISILADDSVKSQN